MKTTKLLLVFLVTLALFSNSLPVSATNSIELEASTVYNLDSKGAKLSQLDANSKAVFKNVEITTSKLLLSGNLVNGKLFDLQGTIKKSENSNADLLVGDLKDSLNNFEVIYFGIDRASNSSLTLNKNKFKGGEDVLKLYLLEKGTRNLTIIETTGLNNLFSADLLFSQQDSLDIIDHANQFWYAKILQGTDIPSFEPQGVVSGKSDRPYNISYSVGGGNIYEEMVIRHYIEGPTSLDTSGGTFTTKMYVLSQRTWSYDYSGLDSNSSNFQVGYFTDTRVDSWTDPGDAIRQIQWDGSYQVAGGIKTQFKIGYSLKSKYVPLTSYEINYQFETPYTAKTLKVFDNSGSNVTRAAGTKYSSGMYLKNTGQTFDVTFTVGHYDTNKQKELYVTWTYDVYNGQSPYAPANGTKTSNMSFSYYSS
ncbi:hypothetical protein [Paenibacillus chitinolyticus]|uniref:hypothetical protein n=1 Tax=Paenibacillus chitinolyticus TaxID=79263 RepID=UPI00366D9DEF